jgi:hypothetical protein
VFTHPPPDEVAAADLAQPPNTNKPPMMSRRST